MNRTAIEWTDWTWNPLTGCLNTCPYCYARRIATRFAGTKAFPHGFNPTMHYSRLHEPLEHSAPAHIFVCSMGNLFGPWVSHDWINAVLRTVTRASHHTFQFLTKYPIHLAAWNPWPENCWLGMTAPYSHVAYNCWFALTKVKAPVRFICFEPLFEGINRNTLRLLSQTVDWIIIGAQTNPLRLPQRSWVESIQEEADAHKIPVFLKNNLQRLFPGEKLRQELP